jgi:cell division protein FtsW
LLLAAVLASRAIGGAHSWIVIGPLQFQPSEVAKLALLIWMGHVLAARRNTLRSLRALLIPVLPVFVIMVCLIMLEPDLGTTVSLGIVFIAVLWFGGAPWWMFASLTATAGVLVVYLANSAGYRSARVAAWLHPSTASPDATYQIRQSLYGLAHGHIFGAGLGQSVSKTGWLPNADSDFIFAIIGEELGLIGAGWDLLGDPHGGLRTAGELRPSRAAGGGRAALAGTGPGRSFPRARGRRSEAAEAPQSP